MQTVESREFRDAVALFPSGVTVVTTCDGDGRPWGFTASAFCSVSLDPPLILVCLEKSADCYEPFREADEFGVSILAVDQEQTARRFATKKADKFGPTPSIEAREISCPLIDNAAAHLECSLHDLHEAGDHVILVGRVVAAANHGREPLTYFNRAFARVAPA